MVSGLLLLIQFNSFDCEKYIFENDFNRAVISEIA